MAEVEDSSGARIITVEELEIKIRAGLENNVEFIKATDLSDGCGSKFEIEIISAEFKGKPLLAQHRLIHKIIAEEREFIHALTLKTKAPSPIAPVGNTDISTWENWESCMTIMGCVFSVTILLFQTEVRVIFVTVRETEQSTNSAQYLNLLFWDAPKQHENVW